MEITGVDVTDCQGGLYGLTTADGEYRCFARLLPAHRGDRSHGRVPPVVDSEWITSAIRCDEELGVTTVVLSVGHPSLTSLLDGAARWALETCMVEEVILHAGSHH